MKDIDKFLHNVIDDLEKTIHIINNEFEPNLKNKRWRTKLNNARVVIVKLIEELNRIDYKE